MGTFLTLYCSPLVWAGLGCRRRLLCQQRGIRAQRVRHASENKILWALESAGLKHVWTFLPSNSKPFGLGSSWRTSAFRLRMYSTATGAGLRLNIHPKGPKYPKTRYAEFLYPESVTAVWLDTLYYVLGPLGTSLSIRSLCFMAWLLSPEGPSPSTQYLRLLVPKQTVP